MGKFRFNRTMHRHGIPYDLQGLIHFRLANINRDSQAFRDAVRHCCRLRAGDEWRALYRFLTDSSVNHVFIYNTFRIPPQLLFRWKREVYIDLARSILNGM